MTHNALAGGRETSGDFGPESVLFRLDVSGRIVFWTEAAGRILGYTADEMVGRSYGRLFPAKEAADMEPERELSHAEINGRARCSGWRVGRDGGQVAAAGVIIAAQRDRLGELVGFDVVCEGAEV